MTPLRPAPAPARWILSVLLPRVLRDDVVANLDDLHQARARERGQGSADIWYWRQALSFPIRLRLAGNLPAGRPFSTRTTIMRSILQDLRFTWRLHRARPGLALVAIVSLAVGIGLNTAIFSVVNSVLLQPTPLEQIDDLVMVWETDRDTGTTREPASLPDFLDFRDRSRTFGTMGALAARETNLTPPEGDPVRLAQLVVSHELLPMLGIEPRLGRLLSADDARPGGMPMVLISESLWARAFDRAPDVVGRRLTLDEQPATIAGVVDDSTDFGVLQILGQAAYSRSFADRGDRVRVDVWSALVPDPEALPRSTHPIFVVGRLAPDTPLEAARQEMTRIAADLEAEYPGDNAARGVNLEPLGDVVLGPVRPALYALLGAVALVLLVACANVANLLLARGTARQREVAVRLALGAGRARLVRQFLTESVTLSVVAGLVGVGLAYAALYWLVLKGPADVPRLAAARIDGTVLALTMAVSVIVGVAFGIFPALQARVAAPRAALGESSRSASAGRDRARQRGALVIFELALAVILVIGAGLLVRSFWHLQQVDPGFRADGVVKAEFRLPATRYPVDFAVFPDFAEQHAFHASLLERARQIPGVTAAAIAGNHPLDPGFTNSFQVVGRAAEAATWPEISVRRVTPGYFETVGLELVEGRLIDARDTTLGPTVSLINRAAAERFFPDQSPIGQSLAMWGSERRIVGVVEDELFQGLTEGRPLATYLPLSQTPSTNGQAVLLVRTDAANPATIGPSLGRAVRSIDPALAVFGVEALDETTARAMGKARFTMTLLAVFAAMALGLAVVGIHGVLSYSVTDRTRELGIRLALGARPDGLRRAIVMQGVTFAAIGLTLGLGVSALLAGVLESLLFDTTPADPMTFGVVAIGLLAVAGAASYLPARRVTRIDPTDALRADG